MRKRPNYNWIEEIYELQKTCCNCKKPFFNWDYYSADLNNKSIYCNKCCEDDSIENDNSYWVNWEYGDVLEYISISNEKAFKEFAWDDYKNN